MKIKTAPKLIWLRESFPWMGNHSGYEQVCDIIADLAPGRYQSIWKANRPLPNLTRRLLKPLTKNVKSSLTYDESGTLVELKALWQRLAFQYDLIHAVYVERNIGLLPQWKQGLSFKLIGTIHQPAGLWRMQRHNPKIVSSLDEVIVLSSREVAYFEHYHPGHVHFIPHGVDVDFFCPPQDDEMGNLKDQRDHGYPRCIFCGTWLRDLSTLADIIDEVLAKDSGIRFDLVVPITKRENPYFYRIARHPQVSWHGGLSDAQLRDLYRNATMLVLPLLDCTANNALLEAIACGLPVVTNDVGGVQDYTDESFADVLPVGDVSGFVEAILRLAGDRQECIKRGKNARSFVEQKLTWDRIAAQTLQVYEKALA